MKFKHITMLCASVLMLFTAGAYAQMPEENKPADESSIIFYAEFDGNDDTSKWRRFNSSDAVMPANEQNWGTITDGNLLGTKMTTGYGRWGVYYGTGAEAYRVPPNKKKLFFETRFKSMVENFTDSALFTIKGKRTTFGADDSVTMIALAVKGGMLSYGGQGGLDTKTDYEMKIDTWYTVKAELDYSNRTAYVHISDENGVSADFDVQFLWGLEFENIIQFSTQRNDLGNNRVSCTDYVMLWDEEFQPVSTSVADGAKNVSTDTGYSIKFLGSVDSDTAGNITVSDASGNSVDVEAVTEENTVNLYFPAGLKYSEKYTVTVPASVKSTDGTQTAEKLYTFTTESKPFYVDDIVTSLSGNKAEAFVHIKNSGTGDKKVYLLMAVYDSELKLVKMKNVGFTVKAQSDEVISCDCDISGTGGASVKAYLWNGYEE